MMKLLELGSLFQRDIDRLYTEIESYPTEASLWIISNEIANSGGNLCLHLIGNLSHFVGKEIGGLPYARDREFEFGGKNVPKAELLKGVQKLRKIMSTSLEGMNESLLEKEYPVQVFGYPMSHSYFLIHLYGHLNYHLGQINYHRRLLTSSQ